MGAVTVTGTQRREQTVFPLLVTGHYYLHEDATRTLPFLGLGLGAYRVSRVLDIGPTSSFGDARWLFGFAPELGVVFPSGNSGLVLATKFHYAFKAGDTPQQTYFNFNVGGIID